MVSDNVSTHYDGCWTDPKHLACAVAEIERQRIRESMTDNVNHPPHYTAGGVETIDYLRAKLGVEGFVAYCTGNAIKYCSRAGRKNDAAEDYRKAAWYCERAAKALEGT